MFSNDGRSLLKRIAVLALCAFISIAYMPGVAYALEGEETDGAAAPAVESTEGETAVDDAVTEEVAPEEGDGEEAVVEEEPQEAAAEEAAEEAPAPDAKEMKAAPLRGEAKSYDISYTPAKALAFTEGESSGYLEKDEDGNEYYYYNVYRREVFKSGDVLTVNGVDYTMPDFGDDVDFYDKYFEDSEGNTINVDELDVYTNQSDNHWTPGTDNAKITIEYRYEDEDGFLYLTCDLYATIEENPVKEISFEFAEPLYLVEGDGEWTSDEVWDEETGTWKDFEWFAYNIPYVGEEGNKLTVNDVVYTCNYYGEFESKDGDFIDADDIRVLTDQSSDNQWSMDNPGKITIEYKGRKCVFDAVIHENPVKEISFEFAEPLTYYENCDGYQTSGSVYDESTGEWNNVEYYRYYIPGRDDRGNKLTVNGVVYTCNYDDEYVSADGDVINARDISIEDNQSAEHPWTTKNPGKVTVTYKGRSYDLTATIVENPTKTVEFEFKEPVTLIEGVDGYNDSDWDSETGTYKQYFRYRTPEVYKAGNIIKVNGEVYTYKFDIKKHKRVFRNADGSKVLDSDYIDYSDDQSYTNQWTVDHPGKVIVSYMGVSGEATVNIVKNPVTRISYEPAEKLKVYENASGHMYGSGEDEDFEDDSVSYFYYSVPSIFRQDSKLYVNGKPYTYDVNARAFINGNDKIDRSEVSTYSDQSYSNQWSKDKPGKITISYMSQTCTVPVEVVDNPVQKIEFKVAEPLSVNEYINGSMVTDEIKKDDGSYEKVSYYQYYTPYVFREGSKLIVNGVEYAYTYNHGDPAYVSKDEDVIFVDEESEYPDLRYTSDQSAENPWTVDHPGKITITYMGKTAEVPVTVNKSTVTSIAYKMAEPFTVYENMYGEWEEDNDGNEYFEYDDTFYARPGDKLIVNGTEYSYKRVDYYDDDGWHGYDYYFENSNGQLIHIDDLDWTDNQSATNHWSIDNPGKVTLSYGGQSTEVTVNVIPNPVKSIEYKNASVPRIMEYTNGTKYDDYDYEYIFYRYYFPGFEEGDQLTVEYTDGRGKVTYTAKYQATDDGDVDFVFVSPDGKDVINPDDLDVYNNQYSKPWGVGEHEFTISYFDKEAAYKVNIYESNVASISFSGAQPITAYEGYGYEEEDFDDEPFFEYNIVEDYHEGDKLTLNHKDGSKTVYTYKQVNANGRLAFVDASGNEIADNPQLESYQYDEHWKLGSDNEMLLSCFGKETVVKATVKENPVASITPQLSHPVVVKSENASYRRDANEKVYKNYSISGRYRTDSGDPLFVDGDKVVVKFKDNTQKTFTYSVNADWFVDEEGDYAYRLSYEDDQYKDHWVKGGANPVYLKYLGVRSVPMRAMIDEVIEVRPLTNATVTPVGNATYTGQPVEHSFKVVLDGRTLVENFDYVVSYENNVNAGTAKATITGINNFSGTKSVEFTIVPKQVTPQLVLDRTDFEYNGQEQRPNVTVMVGGKAVEADLTWPATSVAGGTYTVTATLKGNYTGSGSATYTIQVSPADQAAADAAGKAAEAKAATAEAAQKAADASTAAAGAKKASTTAVKAAKTSVAEANEYLKKANAAKVEADAALEAAKATGKQALIDSAEQAVRDAAADVTAAEAAVKSANSALTKAEDAAWKGVYKKTMAKISISKLVKGKKSFTVKWKKLTTKQKKTCSKIEIQYSLKKSFPRKQTVTKTVSKTKTSYKATKLKSKKYYYVRIRTIKTVSGVKQVGKWSKVKKIKTK